MVKKICSVCNGNGFVRVPYEQAKEEAWADCTFCNNQGEIEETEEDKMKDKLINKGFVMADDRGPLDLTNQVDVEKRKVKFLQGVCRIAGGEIKILKSKLKEETGVSEEDLDYSLKLRGKL